MLPPLLKYLAMALVLLVAMALLASACLDEGDVDDCAHRGWTPPTTALLPVAMAAQAKPKPGTAKDDDEPAKTSKAPRRSPALKASPAPARPTAPTASKTPTSHHHGVDIDIETDGC